MARSAGYLGGRIDALMMRIVDILYSLPFVFFVIILMVMFDRNFILLFVAIGAVEWLTMARIVRGQTLSIKQKEFIEAARAAGVGPLRHHHPPCHSQCGGAGDGLCHPDGAGRDPDRKLPVLPGAGHPGAADQLGRADLRRRRPDGNRALDAAVPGPVHGGDPVLLQLQSATACATPSIRRTGERWPRCWKSPISMCTSHSPMAMSMP